MICLVVDADPGRGRINGRAVMRQLGRNGPRRIGKSDAYKGFVAAVADAARRKLGECAPFRGGVLAVAITFYCSTERHLESLPRGVRLGELDVDASIKATLDGLQAGGLVDDDCRFLELHARKRVDPRRPRVAVSVWTLNPAG